jgi:tetratricopeptide (TPR) repeat protein
MQTVIALAHEVLESYAGTIIYQAPEGFTAVFGAPMAQEDHARRAVLAALELQQRLQQHPTFKTPTLVAGHAISMGIHSGLVVVGGLGEGAQGLVPAVGVPTHLATRLQKRAAPGTIVLSATTYALVHEEVRGEPCGHLALDGQHVLLQVYTVQGLVQRRAGVPRRPSHSWSPFVGRQRQLALLHDCFEAVQAFAGQVVSLVGPPGMGKTRLLTEFRRRLPLDQVTWYAGQCLAYGPTTPYLPVRDIVQQLCAVAEGDAVVVRTAAVRHRLETLGHVAEEDVAVLLQLLDLPVAPELLARLSPETRQARTCALLGHLVLHEAQRRPLVLAVEDVHWIDPSSEAWLASLVERLAGAAVLLLVTYRPGYQPRWRTHATSTQLALLPLRAEDSQAVVEAVPGTAHLPEALRQQIVAYGAGNPFFVEELAWHAVEYGRATTPVPVPETVHAVLAARMDRLLPEEKGVLQMAASIGTEVPFTLLQAIAELSEEVLSRALAHLQAAEFLYETRLFPEREYTFKHALTHEVAYGSLLQERRRALHGRIVEAIERLYADRLTEQVERLAHHALRGKAWDKALTYYRQSGTKAFVRSAIREAVAYFEQALVAIRHLPEHRETIEQAIDLRLALRNALVALGEWRAILDYLREAETLAETLDDHRRLGWVCAYMTDCILRNDLEHALAYGQRALALATASGDFALEVMATFFVGQCYLMLGNHRQTVHYHRKNVEALVGAWLHERFDEAGLPAVFSRAQLVRSLAELGEFAEGSARGAEAMRIAETVEQPFTLSHAYLGVGYLHLRKGDLSQAIAMLEKGLEVCRTGDVPMQLPLAAGALGYAYALSGHLAEALPLLEQAVKLVAARQQMGGNYPLWVAHLGEAYLLAGRLEDAHLLAEQALARARDCKQRGDEAYALRLRGEIAAQRAPLEVESAVAAYQQAIVLAEELEMRPLLAHCYLGLGTLYSKAGRWEQARTALSVALALYRAMDMTFWLPQAQRALAAGGGT